MWRLTNNRSRSWNLLKRMQIVRVDSSDGELHYVFLDAIVQNGVEPLQELNKADAIRITKKEACKPLLIVREA